jgi:hypothetical protein
MKKMLITFLDKKGTVHFEFIPRGPTVNQAYYVQIRVFKRLCEAVCRQGRKLWPNDSILHHNNAPAHKAFPVKQFLVQKSTIEMENPTCSPALAPNNFWLF